MAGINTESVQRLYVAYFNRPADPVSLATYESLLPSDRVATQAELEALANTYFSPSAEYTANYAGLSNAGIVNQLYLNIFGREAEPDGLIHWAGQLSSGAQTVASIALQLSYSAQGTDADVVANRIAASVAFTEGLDTTAEITGFSGNSAASSARSWLATVGSTDASKDAAIAGVDSAISSAVAAGDAASGSSYTLTTAVDSVVGSASNDTIVGTLLATGSTFTVADTISGGNGTDTVTISSSGTSNSISAVTMSEVEVLKVIDAAATKTTLDRGDGWEKPCRG
jgi:hypothetical protein